MKDGLFELLLDLFERTLTQLKKEHALNSSDVFELALASAREQASSLMITAVEVIQSPKTDACRVFTVDEREKLTKASYQFLVRLNTWGVISFDEMETILNQLMFSESQFVSLQETKRMIRNTMASTRDSEEMAFLDLVLYASTNRALMH